MTDNRRIVSREVDASVIPAGTQVKIPAGTSVNITHRLGGNFTVVSDYGMFRISGRDADAIGEDIPETATAAQAVEKSFVRPTEEVVWEALKTVYDPEIPVNIVDLGLVYSMKISPVTSSGVVHEAAVDAVLGTEVPSVPALTVPEADILGWNVDVKMTLTAPGCGMGPVIAEDAKTRCLSVGGVTSAQVDIVWDPPWDQSMISEEGKMELGLI